MTQDEPEELGYHLQELRADLGSIRDNLQVASSSETQRVIARAWIFAWGSLEHDLEVHLPRAFELLGSTLPPDAPPEGRRAGDAALPASIAREARRLVDAALAALPTGIELLSSAEQLIQTARLTRVAYQIVAQALPAVVANDEPSDPDEP